MGSQSSAVVNLAAGYNNAHGVHGSRAFQPIAGPSEAAATTCSDGPISLGRMGHHRPSKHLRAARPLNVGAMRTAVQKYDGRWIVQQIVAGRSVKEYRCPECNRMIPAGTAHVVAWLETPPIGATSPVEFRHHFHTSCWNRRP